MDTREILDRLRTAKSAHLGWVNRARALIDGKPVDKDKVPVKHTDCIFGKWYYGDGRKLASLPSYQAIEAPHDKLHAIYQEIFDLLFSREREGFIARIFDSRKKQEQRREQARARFRELQQMSDVIVARLDALERDVRAMAQRLEPKPEAAPPPAGPPEAEAEFIDLGKLSD